MYKKKVANVYIVCFYCFYCCYLVVFYKVEKRKNTNY